MTCTAFAATEFVHKLLSEQHVQSQLHRCRASSQNFAPTIHHRSARSIATAGHYVVNSSQLLLSRREHRTRPSGRHPRSRMTSVIHLCEFQLRCLEAGHGPPASELLDVVTESLHFLVVLSSGTASTTAFIKPFQCKTFMRHLPSSKIAGDLGTYFMNLQRVMFEHLREKNKQGTLLRSHEYTAGPCRSISIRDQISLET